MRQLPRTACAYLIGLFIAAASVPAFASDIGLTVDLMAPSTACVGSKCPSDISLPQLGNVIAATSGTLDGALGTVTLDATASSPVVCSEQQPNGFGPATNPVAYHFSPIYTNTSPGGQFEFDAGGPSVVDASAAYDGVLFAASRLNTVSSQVACYPINALGVTKPIYADSSIGGDRVFYNAFEGGHIAGEPWVSVQTVVSPNPGSTLNYVVQIHNAATAVNWHVSFGFDHALFSPTVNGENPGIFYVLNSTSPQPGAIHTSGLASQTFGTTSAPGTTYVIASGDIQPATNSVYLYVQEQIVGTLKTSWATLGTSFYPSSVSIFAPPGTYAQRLDDKSAVVGPNNVPTLNIGSIVCANDASATSCTVRDADGNIAPLALKNQVSSGAVTVDPLAYFVDPTANTNYLGTLGQDAIGVSNISCLDPNGIFSSPVSSSNFAPSIGGAGGQAFNFSFAPSGSLYVPGTATCTATFTASGYAPTLSTTQSFTVTMQQLTVTHFEVTADATATAGTPANFTVTAKDGANNTVPSYTGTVKFSSSDAQAVLPANSLLTNGVGSFSGTFKTAGSQTFTATDTVSSTIHGTSNNVTVSSAAANSFSVVMLGNATVNVATGVNVTALDQFGNEATSYAGTVIFTSTDGVALLPLPGPLNHGSHGAASVTFLTAGTQTITVTDGSITGTSNNVVVDN